MTVPSPFFRRRDQGVRSSGALDSPDFQKNTCARDRYYTFTHTKLRRALYYVYGKEDFLLTERLFGRIHPVVFSAVSAFSRDSTKNFR